MFKSNPENVADIEALVAKLTKISHGNTIRYSTLSGTIGRSIQMHYWLLRKAIMIVEKDTGSLFEVVRSVGVKRLESSETPGVGLHCIRKIRRTAKRGVSRLETIRANDLSADDRIKIIAHRSQLGAISMVADGRKSATIAKNIGEFDGAIPAGRVLEFLKG